MGREGEGGGQTRVSRRALMDDAGGRWNKEVEL